MRPTGSLFGTELISRPQVRKQASTTLPSFSTGSFAKPRASGSHSKAAFHGPISISSDSTPSPGIKRSSSDSHISDQPSKRLKSEKENLFKPEPEPYSRPNDKGKGKAKTVPSRSTVEDDDDEPWKRMKTPEPDPFKMLDRDHPKFCVPPAHSAPPVKLNTNYPDLLSVRPYFICLVGYSLTPHQEIDLAVEQYPSVQSRVQSTKHGGAV